MNFSTNIEVNDLPVDLAILEVAERLFLEKGFALTSTTEIAKMVGCNQALIHYYFRTKENLFQKVFESKILEFSRAFFQVDTLGGTFPDRLERMVMLHFDMMAKNPRFPFMMIREISTHPDRALQLKERLGNIPLAMMERLEADLEVAIEVGEIRPISVLNLILNVISMNAGMFLALPALTALMDLSPEDAERLVSSRKREIVDTVIRSLRP